MLSNKQTICITGASDGLGRSLALLLAKQYDLNLILCGRTLEKLQRLETEIHEINPATTSKVYCFDMLHSEAIQTFIQEAFSNQSIDILINNAGANLEKATIEHLQVDLFQAMMQLNCTSHVQITQAVLPQMITKKQGHIINVLSSVCLHNMETLSAYTASKKAMEAVSKILTKEVRPHNIKVTAVYPGGIDTNFRVQERKDYMHPDTVAKAIVQCLQLEDDAILQEIVLRPFIESNY
ncbi:MAG: SDR family oxidoreductase [Erysipelotrichaceae bacterium]